MTPVPTIGSLWSYVGPNTETPAYQLHKVIHSHPKEIITIGLPYGRGGTWLGPIELFRKEFQYKGIEPA